MFTVENLLQENITSVGIRAWTTIFSNSIIEAYADIYRNLSLFFLK